MTRRSLSASEAIDEIDSPVDGLEGGSLSIPSQTTGNVTGLSALLFNIKRKQSFPFFSLFILCF